MAELASIRQPSVSLRPRDIMAMSRQLKEPLAISRGRVVALERFLSMPLPSRAEHLWKYSDPSWFIPVDHSAFSWTALAKSSVSVSLSEAARNAKVTVEPLRSGQEQVGSVVQSSHGPLEALNAATWTKGAVIRVPSGTNAGRVRVRVTAEKNIVSRLLVVLEQGAAVQISEEHRGARSGIASHVTEIIADQDARAEHLCLGLWSEDAVAHLTSRANLGKEASYKASFATLGGGRVKLDVGAIFDGSGASSDLSALAIGGQDQSFDTHTAHHHRALSGRSNLSFRAALLGRARSAYTGLIRIEETARLSEAYQEARSLLLSPDSHADAIPQLEILTNEVSCTHGATTAPFDENEFFYLSSRGLDSNAALRLLIHGFFAQAIEGLSSSSRQWVERVIDKRLQLPWH